jgi:23S rRNA pseudouridine1911/1915/1917 synthase
MNEGTAESRLVATVAKGDAGARLDKFLAESLSALSRARIKGLIEAGRVSAAGETITEPSYRVKPGQRFQVRVPPPEVATPTAQSIPLVVVHEDADLIVVDKPAGLVVHPAPGNPDRTLVNALIHHCGDSLSGIGGVRRPGIVHRLDKDTSGLLVAAKTDAAHAGLAAQFAAHSVERAYHALVWGVPSPARGEIEGNIGRNPRNRKKMAVVKRGGKPALTRYRVLRRFGETASLVECRLATGRTHQIRVHLAARGHPVIGDPLYGRAQRGRRSQLPVPLGDAIDDLGRQALHASVLGFKHPASGERFKFESKLPLDINSLLILLELI